MLGGSSYTGPAPCPGSLCRLAGGHGKLSGCLPLAPQIETLVAVEPEPQASVPENCQVVPGGFQRLWEEQMQPEEALCTRLLKKSTGQAASWLGGKKLGPGLCWSYLPMGLKSPLNQTKGNREG